MLRGGGAEREGGREEGRERMGEAEERGRAEGERSFFLKTIRMHLHVL